MVKWSLLMSSVTRKFVMLDVSVSVWMTNPRWRSSPADEVVDTLESRSSSWCIQVCLEARPGGCRFDFLVSCARKDGAHSGRLGP